MNLARFKERPLLGILRGISSESLDPLLETVEQNGLETVEITMNTPGAPRLIKQAVRRASSQLMIGAGTVLTLEDMKSALEAGATFIVTPVFVKSISDYCVKHQIPVFPGALTPKEIYQAWSGGATMVKVFPVRFFGPEYFKEIKGPFQDIELLACSGVTPNNLKAYFDNGASAVAIGSSVFRKDWMEAGDYQRIGERIREFIAFFASSGFKGEKATSHKRG